MAAALTLAASVGALLSGLAYGPMLSSGQIVPSSWAPYIAIAAVLAGIIAWMRHGRISGVAMACWTFAGSCLSVLILSGIAGQAVPPLGMSSQHPVSTGPREPLAIHSGPDLFWGQGRTLSELGRAFRIDRLDVLSPAKLDMHDRLLLAQPRLLAPQELVALDHWIRDGGRAVILADPFLVWPSDLALGDRRRPPVTSLLDPLLAHWGIKLEAASSLSLERRFLKGDRLLAMAGVSHFTIAGSRFAHCWKIDDGWSIVCRVGKGKVRLIADADLLDERIWQTADGHLTADNIALIDRWLRDPLADDGHWQGEIDWVRSRQHSVEGLRWALLAGTGWAILGGLLVFLWEKRRADMDLPDKRLSRQQVQNMSGT